MWAIFEGGGGSITINTSHGDAEESADSEELVVGVAETCAKFEDDEEHVVDDEWPEVDRC